MILRDTNKLFHNFGPAIAKAWSPFEFNRDLGTIKSLWSDDLKRLTCELMFNRSGRYVGAGSIL